MASTNATSYVKNLSTTSGTGNYVSPNQTYYWQYPTVQYRDIPINPKKPIQKILANKKLSMSNKLLLIEALMEAI